MTCSDAEDRAPPYVEVDAKRPDAVVPVQADWHDYLINERSSGKSVALNYRMRPRRVHSTGFQYKCTFPGVTSGQPWNRIPWPKVAAGTVVDGSVTWEAEAIAANSLRTTISTEEWPAVTGLTLSGAASDDLVYEIQAAGGTSGDDYEVKHNVVLANGEAQSAVALLPVRD